jgi:hypothetical protein
MNVSTSPGESPVRLGILLVHGIGEQRRSDTLVNWLDTLIATINTGTKHRVSATVECADLAPPGSGNESAQAIVRIRGEGIDERWIVVEGWWAEAFIAPPFSQLVGWSFRAIPWALAMHAAQGLHRSDDVTDARERFLRTVGGVARAIFLLLLAPFIILLLAGLTLIGLIPSDTLRTSIGRFQRKLAATAGDSLVLLESPVRSAAMCSAVMSAFGRLERICSAAHCTRRAVVAHSQGATVSLEALTQLSRRSASDVEPAGHDDARTSRTVFITFGAGINKLGAMRWLSTHRLADLQRDERTGAQKGRDEKARDDDAVIERDPVLAACLGLLAMAGVGFWFWRLLATGQMTVTELWVIPAVWLGGSAIVGTVIELMKRLIDHHGKRHPWLKRSATGIVMAIFLTFVIGGIVAAERTDAPVMPFVLAGVLAIMLILTLRLTLSRRLQDEIKSTIDRPSNVDHWSDFWATADPVPNGATRTKVPDCPIGTRIWNEASVLRDHTTYWQNLDGFVLPVVRILARAAQSRWCDALPPEHVNINERSRWRVGWLRATRWPVAVAIALAVLQRAEELERARGSAGDAMSTLGIGEWLGRIPHAWMEIGVLGGAALLSAWIAYSIVVIVWRAWVGAEQAALLEHNAPNGTTVGLYLFGSAVMLLFAAAVYIGRTDWPTFIADWQHATLADGAVLVFGIALWGCVIVWLVAKWFPPPTAVSPGIVAERETAR